MDPIGSARTRLDRAARLPAVLDAAYEAFENMLPAIFEDQQDPDGGAFAGPVAGAVIAIGVAHVLRGPARVQEAAASEGTPLNRAV